jgi:hypothetical protein
VEQLHRPPGIGDIDDRGPVCLYDACQGITGAALVVADVENETIALLYDRRFVSGPPLQITMADPFHVMGIDAIIGERNTG